MALLIECPRCKKRNSENARTCTGKKDGTPCGFALSRLSGRVWWIEYYQTGKRKREKIGPNKTAAEQRLREIKSAMCEGRYIHKSPDSSTRFQDLAQWYLTLPEVQAKRSFGRDKWSLKKLLPFFGERLLKDIPPAMVEAYRQKRLAEPSGRSPQQMTKPATVNREIALLKTIFNKAIKNGKADCNPPQGVKQLKENNERDRVLTQDEYDNLLTHCPGHLKPIVKLAFHTGMRQGEILNLAWGQLDLREGFIQLRPEDTKTNESRLVYLPSEMLEIFKAMPRGLPGVKVFTYAGKSISSIKRGFTTACKKAGIENFTFHDLRHTAINNWRLQGHDYFRIMAATGHKTMSVFKRYNTVSRDELKALAGRGEPPRQNNNDGHQYGHPTETDTTAKQVTI
jgi:integrase